MKSDRRNFIPLSHAIKVSLSLKRTVCEMSVFLLFCNYYFCCSATVEAALDKLLPESACGPKLFYENTLRAIRQRLIANVTVNVRNRCKLKKKVFG